MKSFFPETVSPRQILAALLVAGVVPLLLMLPLAADILERFDYHVHREAAWNFAWPAHFLYYLFFTAFRFISVDWLLAQKMLLLTNYAVLGLVLWLFLSKTSPSRLAQPILALLAASLVFVYAIPGLQPLDGHYYKGYLATNVYHNSTSLLLKPFLILHLLWLHRWLQESQSDGHWPLLGGALLVVLSALAKPSYLVILLPAVFVLIVRRPEHWRSALLAVFLPGIAVLVWLFLGTFAGATGSSGGLEIAPLKVLTHYTEAWTILPKALLSLVFPLTVLLLFRREALQDRLTQLCWLMLLFGFAYGLLLAERGERVFDGNWLWSGQLAAFALFAATLRLLLTLPAAAGWRHGAAWAAYGCHFVAGLAWYLVQFQENPTLYW
jgi:hypothetical protein